MTDLDLKNECMEDAEIDLTIYSNNELTQIREAMRMYAERKLKLFAIPVVRVNEVAVCDCYKDNKDNVITVYYCKKHKQFFAMQTER